MAKYEVLRDTWISHQNIVAKAGTVIDVEFPKVDGKAMQIGDNLRLVRDGGNKAQADKAAADKAEADKAGAALA